MFLHLLCGSYFPVKGQEVIEMRIERNSWLMSSWLFHPSFLLCLFSSFWHLGKACYFHWVYCDHIFRQSVGGSPLLQTLGEENAERKHELWPLQNAVLDCWDLLFLAISARKILSTLSFPGSRSNHSLTFLSASSPNLVVLAGLHLFCNKEMCKATTTWKWNSSPYQEKDWLLSSPKERQKVLSAWVCPPHARS